MTLKVFVFMRNSTLSLTELRQLLPSTVEIIEGDEIPVNSDFDILVHGFPTREEIEASPNLRAVIAPFAGAPKETIELLQDYPHISLHSVHFNVVPTAELAMGLLLAAAKFIVPMDRELRLNDWRSRYGNTPTVILEGRCVTILGYGRIGQRIGMVCHALGMKVIGVRRHVQENHAGNGADAERSDPIVSIYPPSALHEVLPRSNVLIIALPLTAETENMIGADELALLPPDAILINVGRGHVVNEEALYQALLDKTLLAAGIDVWYHYPMQEDERASTPPSRLPFHVLDNVVMSPHRGGWLSAAEPTRVSELALLLTDAAEGRPISSLVDKNLGY
jgi:phosphoglycerate dehydrogenase-like enzyme